MDCWNCYKKNACGILYCNGEQKVCKAKQEAYKSYQNYIEWSAKADSYNAGYLFYKGGNQND